MNANKQLYIINLFGAITVKCLFTQQLIKEAKDFDSVIDYILNVRGSNMEYLAIALDESVADLKALKRGEKLLARGKLVQLCHLYSEACLVARGL